MLGKNKRKWENLKKSQNCILNKVHFSFKAIVCCVCFSKWGGGKKTKQNERVTVQKKFGNTANRAFTEQNKTKQNKNDF